jgi:hypothetical protein
VAKPHDDESVARVKARAQMPLKPDQTLLIAVNGLNPISCPLTRGGIHQPSFAPRRNKLATVKAELCSEIACRLTFPRRHRPRHRLLDRAG